MSNNKITIVELLNNELSRLHVQADEARRDEDFDSEIRYTKCMNEVYILIESLIDKSTAINSCHTKEDEIAEIMDDCISGLNLPSTEEKELCKDLLRTIKTNIPSFPGDKE